MTLRFDLTLQKMKELAGWDEQDYHEYYEKYYLHRPEDYKLPYKLTHPVQLTSNNRVINKAVEYMDYHNFFYRRRFRRSDVFFIANRHLIQFYSEQFANIFTHGGEAARNTDTIVELYHPSDPSKFILRISNPAAVEWDYEQMASKGRGGRSCFSQEFALVSYENGGRDFLALIEPPLAIPKR